MQWQMGQQSVGQMDIVRYWPIKDVQKHVIQ